MKTTRKALSLLLAVMIIITSMSVCFRTITFAASGDASDAEYKALADALKANEPNSIFSQDSVKVNKDPPAASTGSDNVSEVTDYKGYFLNAAAAWWTVFKKVWDPYADSMDYRLTSQINSAILTKLEDYLDVDTYAVSRFLNFMVANVTPDAAVNGWLGSQPKGVTGTCKITLDLTVYIKNFSRISDIPESITTYAEYKVDNASGHSTGSGTKKKKFNAITETSMSQTLTTNTTIRQALLNSQKAIAETYAEYFTLAEEDNLLGLAAKGAETLNTVKTAVSSAKTNITDNTAYNGEQIWKHFFAADYDTKISDVLGDADENIIGDIDKALEILSYSSTVINIETALETNLASIADNITELSKLHGNLITYQKTINEATYKAEIVDHFDLDMTDLQNFINEVKVAWDLAVIKFYKTNAQEYMNAYGYWTKEDVLDSTITTTDLISAYANINFVYEQIANCDKILVSQVCGDDFFSKLDAVNSNIEVLMQASDSRDKFMPAYNEFKSTIKDLTVTTLDTYELLENLKGYDKWYEELNDFIEKIEKGFGEEIAQQLMQNYDDEIKEHMNKAYDALYSVIEPQIQVAYDIFYSYTEIYGDKVSMASYKDFLAIHDELQASLGLIDKDIFDFLSTTNNGGLSEEGAALYGQIENALASYQRFETNKGLDAFHTSTQETEREDTNEDIARENQDTDEDGIGEYTVTDENVEKVINFIESALKNEKVSALLGELINKDENGNPTGESFGIGTLIEGVLNEFVYTDSIINTIMQFVYPIVCKEFAKVWVDLPATIEIPGVDTGIAGLKANVNAGLSLYDAENAVAAVGIYLAPSTLANNLRNDYNTNSGQYAKYEEVIEILESVTTKAVYDKGANKDDDSDDIFTNPWEDEKLFEYVLDDEGNKVQNDDGTYKQVYKLDWGVDEAENKREAFINAACAALSGLEPLLLAILTNQNQANAEDSDSTPRGNKIGAGSGSAKVQTGLTWPSELDLKLTIDPITLVLKFSGNDGWDNALVPIFEAFGLENIPHSEELTTTRKIIEDGLLKMIDQIIEKLDEAPVKFILDILPNLCYALEAGFVSSLLGMLKTDITYYADAQYKVNAYLTTVEGKMDEAMASKKELENGEKVWDPIKINLGEMINLSDMGIDLDNGIMGLLGSFFRDSNFPEINGAALATMGELEWRRTNRSEFTYNYHPNDKAAFIVSNRADVLEYIIKYALSNLNTLLVAFNVDTAAMGELVETILTNISTDADATVAAIVELLNQQRYDTLEDYKWYQGSYVSEEELNFTPATDIYLNPGNDWTKEKAEYFYKNLETILDSVLAMAGVEFDLEGIISGVFTDETLTSVAKLLGTLGAFAEDESISGVLKEFMGVDLGSYAQYKNIGENEVIDFGVTDAVSFANALVELLAPIKSVFDFILAGENLQINLSENDKITLVGYNGYDSAVVPILEALGCEVKTLSEKDNAIKVVLDAVAAKMDSLTKDGAIKGIIDILPGVIFFISSNGLTTAVRNLLQPVYVILDTIRPIYDIDLDELVSGIEIGIGTDGKLLGINLSALNVGAIVDLIENITGLRLAELKALIYDVAECVATEYTSASTLQSNWKKGSYSDNFNQADMLTVILSFVLEWASVKDNAQVLDKLIGTDIISALEKVFADIEITYTVPDWNYALADNGTVDAMKYSITYPNNWTEETAAYVVSVLPEIGDMVATMIDSNYSSLGALLRDKVNIFTSENLESIVTVITKLLGGISDGLMEAAGVLLDVNLAGLRDYKVKENITTAEEFADELSYILSEYAQGIVEWALLGNDYRFFVKSGGEQSDFITINGAHGYSEGIVLILEALGCENLPDAYDGNYTTKEIITGVLTSLAKRIDEIFVSPVEEVLNLLPNLLYFLNTNGVAAVVDNTTAAVTVLLDKLRVFGINIAINELIDIKSLMGLEDTDAKISLDNLSMADILEAVSLVVGIDLTLIESVIVGFALGRVEEYQSVSVEVGTPKKMTYKDEFDKHDMITVLANLAILTLSDERNAEFVRSVVGEDIYEVIIALFDIEEIPVQDFAWIETDKADTGYVFSAMDTTTEFKGFTYGEIYTEKQAQYIADNFGEFIDNIIYLVGIEMNGKTVNNLTELISNFVNGTLYNSDNLVAIRDALAGILANISGLEVKGVNVGKYIVEVLRKSMGVDLSAVAEVEVPEFKEDRDMFVTYLCDILEPLYPIIKFILADKDISFFINTEGTDAITLKGAKGYAYGIIPLLEVLDCEDILTPAEYNKTQGDELITSILTPLLNRVDDIMEAPADEILEILPNIIYFINSNGLDTVVKNTLNAVYALFAAIEPVAKIDLYELVGIDLATIDFNWIVDKLLEKLEDMGYTFTIGDIKPIAELTVGELKSYTSVNGNTAYKMVYAGDSSGKGNKAEMVTVIERLAITFIVAPENQEAFIKLLKDKFSMGKESEEYIRGTIKLLADSIDGTSVGMQLALSTIYYIFYGLDEGVSGTTGGLKDINKAWKNAVEALKKVNPKAAESLEKLLGWEIFEDVIDTQEGLAPNGIVKFIQKITDWFKGIGEWFKSIFSSDK